MNALSRACSRGRGILGAVLPQETRHPSASRTWVISQTRSASAQRAHRLTPTALARRSKSREGRTGGVTAPGTASGRHGGTVSVTGCVSAHPRWLLVTLRAAGRRTAMWHDRRDEGRAKDQHTSMDSGAPWAPARPRLHLVCRPAKAPVPIASSATFSGAKRVSIGNLFGKEAQGSIELQLGGNA
jgi:hypothetical protein